MIVLGMPTTGAIPIQVIGSIQNVLMNRKDVTPYYTEGSLVYDARAKIVNYALSQGADVLFVDSDIVFPIEGFDRLKWHDRPIVSGLYFGRHKGQSNPIAYKTVKPSTFYRKKPVLETIDEIKPFMEVEGAGLGFCLVQNKVLRAFGKENPFEPFGNLGEDLSFFTRCRRKGFKIMLDSSFALEHIGQYSYTAQDYKAQCKTE